MQQSSIEIEREQGRQGSLRIPGLLSGGTTVQSRGQEFISRLGGALEGA